MSFLLYTVALNLLVLAVSANHSAPIETGQLTSVFKPPTAAKVYNSCGSACPPTCANPKPQVCILVCKDGWFCPKDYYLNSAGNCVLKEYCENVQPTPDPVPLPQPFPTYPFPRPFPRPLPRPLPRPFPRPFPVPFPEPFVQNVTEVSDDFGQFPEWPSFQSFEPVESHQIRLSSYPTLPKPSFQISPINYNATAVANGAPIPPPAVVRTSGSNAPYIPSPPMVPQIKPLIDFDPTFTRPVLRVSKEQSSEDEK